MLVFLASAAFAADPAPAAPAPAAPAPVAAAPTFESFDLNKDLSLDKTEVAKHAVLTKDFALIDTDKSGKLSKDEFKAWADKQPKP